MSFVLRIVVVAISSLSVASAGFADRVTPTDRVQNSVSVREEPSGQSTLLARLRPGETLESLGNEPGTRYRKVRLANGEGFVSKSFTRVISDAAAGLAERADDELRVPFHDVVEFRITVNISHLKTCSHFAIVLPEWAEISLL